MSPRSIGPEVEYLTREGDPAAEAVRVAKETGCDLIVMGTHGRKGLGRLLLGSVAEGVLPRANCPVLLVNAAQQVLAANLPVAAPPP